jgi:hypothetical protein
MIHSSTVTGEQSIYREYIMESKSGVFRKSPEEYGNDYQSHYLDLYKLYVEMADKISARRQTANSFFLSVNTAVIGLVAYVQLGEKSTAADQLYWLVSLAGMALCYTWARLIRSYRDLNSGKFKVIHMLEQNFPIAPYDAEWEELGKGEDPKLYLPFSRVERNVPWVFFVLHLFVFVQALPWSVIQRFFSYAH